MSFDRVIKTDEEYKKALSRIEEIFDAQPGTKEGDELEFLVLLVEHYEERRFPTEKPTPVEAIRFRMEQEGLSDADMTEYLGCRSKVSEVLSGKRNLSITMIRKLVKGLHIPAEILLGE